MLKETPKLNIEPIPQNTQTLTHPAGLCSSFLPLPPAGVQVQHRPGEAQAVHLRPALFLHEEGAGRGLQSSREREGYPAGHQPIWQTQGVLSGCCPALPSQQELGEGDVGLPKIRLGSCVWKKECRAGLFHPLGLGLRGV